MLNHNLSFAVHESAVRELLSRFHAALPGGVFEFTVAELGLYVQLRFVQPMTASITNVPAMMTLSSDALRVTLRFQGSDSVDIDATFQLGVSLMPSASDGAKYVVQVVSIDGNVPDDPEFALYLKEEVFPKLIEVANALLSSRTFPPAKPACAAPVIRATWSAITGFVALTGTTVAPPEPLTYSKSQMTLWADASFIAAAAREWPIHYPIDLQPTGVIRISGSFEARVQDDVTISDAGRITLPLKAGVFGEVTVAGVTSRISIKAALEVTVRPTPSRNAVTLVPLHLAWPHLMIQIENSTLPVTRLVEEARPLIEAGLSLAFEAFAKKKPFSYPLPPICFANGSGAMFLEFDAAVDTVQRTDDYVVRAGITPQIHYQERTKC